MSSSIWDTRFNNQSVAQDADDEGDQQWITVNGAHILVDGNGTVIGGAKGKFNGQRFVKAGIEVGQRAKEKQKMKEAEKEARAFFNKGKLEGHKFDREGFVWNYLFKQYHTNDPDKMSDEQLEQEYKDLKERLDKKDLPASYPSTKRLVQERVEWMDDVRKARRYENRIKENVENMDTRQLEGELASNNKWLRNPNNGNNGYNTARIKAYKNANEIIYKEMVKRGGKRPKDWY